MGSPHNVIRHPDMPKDAFSDLWKHLQNGKPWMGMVKNRRTDGQFYWVDAYASPLSKDNQIFEYQSVRTLPSRENVARAEKVYQTLSKGRKPFRLMLPRTRLWLRLTMIAACFAGL
ncbi:aerotaxis sensor receptor protein [Vibrio maritimus]|uniref:Aerotaxis sensor receptor protein n=1 Tax=Vibrio maritimus TaxID=990268 RepID=A0A090T462_9VIBR|nr:aerotaxis sensor receptor protein [Vibrio maritimus]